jgi:hypothetical protein
LGEQYRGELCTEIVYDQLFHATTRSLGGRSYESAHSKQPVFGEGCQRGGGIGHQWGPNVCQWCWNGTIPGKPRTISAAGHKVTSATPLTYSSLQLLPFVSWARVDGEGALGVGSPWIADAAAGNLGDDDDLGCSRSAEGGVAVLLEVGIRRMRGMFMWVVGGGAIVAEDEDGVTFI